MIILGTMFLNIGHPGLVFAPNRQGTASAPVAPIKDEHYSSGEESKAGAMV